MEENICEGKWENKGVMNENWSTTKFYELEEFGRELEKMSDVLQEYRSLKHDAEAGYTIFD